MKGIRRLEGSVNNPGVQVTPQRMVGRFRVHLIAILWHILLSLFFTWPLALNLLPGAPPRTPGIIVVDRDQNLWNLWWVRHALMQGQNPFVTDVIWYPTPVSLFYHTLNLFNGLLAVPLLSVFSLVTTYNLIVLFSFIMSGYGAFLLVRYISGNAWAGMVGSVVFAYSAFHIATMRGLLQLISLEWVPFFILFLLKALHSNRWTNRSAFMHWLSRAAFPASFFLFLIALVDWYYTMYALILTGLLVLNALVVAARQNSQGFRSGGEVLLRAGIPIALFLVLIAPILLPTIAELRTTSYMLPASDEAVRYSADLMSFFEPPQDHRLWGHLFQNRRDWPFGSNRYEVYFTYTALFLVGVGLFTTRRPRPSTNHRALPPSVIAMPTKWFWAASALIFFLLALGPVLQINGQPIQSLPGTTLRLLMPYQVIENLPILNISRSPDRFDMPLTLCLAILCGYGVNVLLLRLQRRFAGKAASLTLLVVLVAFLALELFPLPYEQRSAAVPPWYERLGEEEGDFAILELPPQDDYWHGAYRMHYQTSHGKRIFGGYISREYDHPFLQSTPGFQELIYADGRSDMFLVGPETWNSALTHYKVRYIVLQKVRLPGRVEPSVDVEAWRREIERVGNGRFPLVHSDQYLDAYGVLQAGVILPFLAVGDGWGDREIGPNGTFRWMGQMAELKTQAARPQAVYLTFRAAGIGDDKTMRIFHQNVNVFEEKVGALREITVGPINIPQGESTIRFESPEGTVRPSDLGDPSDRRDLGFAILDVRLHTEFPSGEQDRLGHPLNTPESETDWIFLDLP